jgi:hypothetical protein
LTSSASVILSATKDLLNKHRDAEDIPFSSASRLLFPQIPPFSVRDAEKPPFISASCPLKLGYLPDEENGIRASFVNNVEQWTVGIEVG